MLNKEDNNCFFSGSSYPGSYSIPLKSNNTNCIISKFSFVNDTNFSGFFYIYYNNHKRVKESVIVFKPTDTLKKLNYCYSGATLSIEISFMIVSGAIDGGGRVILTS